jgi:hypothetical protein
VEREKQLGHRRETHRKRGKRLENAREGEGYIQGGQYGGVEHILPVVEKKLKGRKKIFWLIFYVR